MIMNIVIGGMLLDLFILFLEEYKLFLAMVDLLDMDEIPFFLAKIA